MRDLSGTEVTVSIKTIGVEDLHCTVHVYDDSDSNSIIVNNVIMVPSRAGTGTKRHTHTFTLPSQTYGQNLNSTGLLVIFSPEGGAEALGNATIDYFHAQLEPGPVATSVEHRPIGTELALCQRYFVRTPNNYSFVYAPNEVINGRTYNAATSFPVTMRATPSIENITSVGGDGVIGLPTASLLSPFSAGFSATATGDKPNGSGLKWFGFDASAEL